MTHHARFMSLERGGTALVVIDVQEKLAAAMKDEVMGSVAKNIDILIRGMRVLGAPVVVTEQYPKGLGATLPQVRDALGGSTRPIEKLEFACTGASGFAEKLGEQGTKTVVLCGMEAHVCVVQTAVGLLDWDFSVWVAEDAICSRTKQSFKAAVRMMEQAGAVVAPAETILFWLLERAGTPAFKEISRLVK